MAQVKVEVDASGFGELTIDGQKIPAVEEVHIYVKGGERPKVFFKLYTNPAQVDLADAEVSEIKPISDEGAENGDD